VHLGDRLLAIARIRSGAASIELIAEEFDIEPADVTQWLQVHGDDRVMLLSELRDGDSPQMRELMRRARLLAELVADADRSIRELHQEYVLTLAASRFRQEI
jgi:transposase-like protein